MPMAPILMADACLLCLGRDRRSVGGFRMDVSFVDRTNRDWVDLNLSRSFRAGHPPTFLVCLSSIFVLILLPSCGST